MEAAFREIRAAVAATLAQLAAAKEIAVAHADVDEAVALLHRRVDEAEGQLPAALSPELERWICGACEIKADHIRSLTSTDNAGGQKAARASFAANVSTIASDVRTVAFVAGEVQELS